MAMWTWFVASVWPNIVASVLWGAPAFITHHKLMKRHITRTQGGDRG